MGLLKQQNNKKQAQTNNAWTDADLQQLLQGRKVPVSPEAEAAVLGSMLLDRECIGDVIEHINADCFSLTEHRIIFESILSLYESNSEIDLVLLRDELKKRKSLDAVGGVDYLVRIAESVPSSANAAYYARIVKDKSMMRELAHACGQIINDACEEGGEIGDKLDEAEQRIFAITEKKIQGTAEPIKNLITQAFEAIEHRKGTDITGKPTGYMELDQMLCGLHNGEMTIMAGRPSMGKTSFALNVAEHMGADESLPIVIFSLEMSRQQLTERLLCSRSGVDAQLVRKGMLGADDMGKLTQAGGELFEKPIFIDDTPGLTPLMIRAKCRRLKSQYDIQAVFIDYLQLMGMGGRVESRQQEISTISRYLKALARELNVPVIVLSQLNRGTESREGNRPKMSDLRESGSIEQDADVVILLHREDYYHRGDPEWEENNEAEVIIAKQRNGPVGTVKLIFDGRLTRFKPMFHQPSPF
jgi:replicative DNA helicase